MTVPHSGMLERPWKDQHTEISRKINAQKFQELTKVGALVRIYRANVKQELKERGRGRGESKEGITVPVARSQSRLGFFLAIPESVL